MFYKYSYETTSQSEVVGWIELDSLGNSLNTLVNAGSPIQNIEVPIYSLSDIGRFGYLDIILLGMIAGFIILRLRSILGRKTGHESKVYPSFTEKKFTVPNKEAEPIKQNLNVLEGKEKKDINFRLNTKELRLVF